MTRDGILGHRVYSRLLGLAFVLAGVGFAAAFTVPTAREVMAHHRVLILKRGLVAAPMMALYMGLILLIAGPRSRDLFSYQAGGVMTRAQWIITIVGLLVCFIPEFGFDWWLGRQGYVGR
jgi:hypothetical protein